MRTVRRRAFLNVALGLSPFLLAHCAGAELYELVAKFPAEEGGANWYIDAIEFSPSGKHVSIRGRNTEGHSSDDRTDHQGYFLILGVSGGESRWQHRVFPFRDCTWIDGGRVNVSGGDGDGRRREMRLDELFDKPDIASVPLPDCRVAGIQNGATISLEEGRLLYPRLEITAVDITCEEQRYSLAFPEGRTLRRFQIDPLTERFLAELGDSVSIYDLRNDTIESFRTFEEEQRLEVAYSLVPGTTHVIKHARKLDLRGHDYVWSRLSLCDSRGTEIQRIVLKDVPEDPVVVNSLAASSHLLIVGAQDERNSSEIGVYLRASENRP